MYSLGDITAHRLGVTIPTPVLVAGNPPGVWTDLVSWSARSRRSDPQPIVLNVQSRLNTGIRAPWMAGSVVSYDEDAAGQRWQDTPYGGALRIEYGAFGVVAERIIDAFDGTYQLPPVHRVSVSARFYPGNASADVPAGVMQCSIAAGIAPGTIKLPTQTATKIFDIAQGDTEYRVPSGIVGYRFIPGWVDAVAAGERITNTSPAYTYSFPLGLGPDQTLVPPIGDFLHLDRYPVNPLDPTDASHGFTRIDTAPIDGYRGTLQCVLAF